MPVILKKASRANPHFLDSTYVRRLQQNRLALLYESYFNGNCPRRYYTFLEDVTTSEIPKGAAVIILS